MPGFVKRLMRAMILFNQIVEVLHLSQCNALGKYSAGFELSYRFGIGRIFIDIDHARNYFYGIGIRWSRRLGHLLLDRAHLRNRTSHRWKRFEEEALGGLCIARWTQEKFQRVSEAQSTAR